MIDAKTEVARLVANSLPAWSFVNVGIGIPTLSLRSLRQRSDVRIHVENGVLGAHALEEDEAWDGTTVDPSKAPMGVSAGASSFDSLQAFGMIHSGRLDVTVMGAYQVSANGDLANWMKPGSKVGGIGGAADLVVGARTVWIATLHNSTNGEPKLVTRCTVPRTGNAVVGLIFTELGVFVPRGEGFEVRAMSADASRSMILERTGAPVEFPAQVPTIDLTTETARYRGVTA